MANPQGLSQRDIVRIAGEAGAKAALDTYHKEHRRTQKEIVDRRLRNTKLLLRNYKMLKDHCENAVYESPVDESPLDILELMGSSDHDGTVFVESIKTSAARTSIIVRHMETMLQLYEAYCFRSGSPEEERRWRVIKSQYLDDVKRPIKEIADEEGYVERTIYNDIDVACEKIAALMFGIDGLKKA